MIKYIDKSRTYISESVVILDNVTIYPDVYIEGDTVIGDGTIIYPFTYIFNSKIGKNNKIYSSHIFQSNIGDNNVIGPYSHLREDTILKNNTKVGSFVETKKMILNNNSKLPHLSYMGDAIIGDNVNVGCGVITANYDGKKKHQTIIEDDAFIGCNSNLIAPLKIGRKSFIAAGSTITDDVPDNTFAIARQRQINKENYIK